MAGAAVISAVQNTLGRRDVPFVFGGDGAVVAAAPAWQDGVRDALARVQTWVRDELALELRTALIPVDAIRAAGHDVRVARFRVASAVDYAMFAGGGARWADSEMKAGRFLIAAAPPAKRPDLTGLSCRWNPIRARNGAILSIIALPVADADVVRFAALVGEVVALLEAQDRGGHPVPDSGPGFRWPPAGLRAEAAAGNPAETRLRKLRRILVQAGIGFVGDRTGRTLGGFDARLYRRDAARNSDFRKFDDGLKLTVDVSASVCDAIEALLERAAADGICRYGVHRQDAALMTCIVPSSKQRDHVHFIDGAAGSYAMAAAQLKGR
jgi:Protein of unknown function (DUF3095)